MAFPVDEMHIAAAERALGRSLPMKLRTRLLRLNGGEIEANNDNWQLFPVFDPTDRRRIRRTANHIVRETAFWRDSHGFPRDAIAIAGNGSGDALIIRKEAEVVEYWDHETGETRAIEINWS